MHDDIPGTGSGEMKTEEVSGDETKNERSGCGREGRSRGRMRKHGTERGDQREKQEEENASKPTNLKEYMYVNSRACRLLPALLPGNHRRRRIMAALSSM